MLFRSAHAVQLHVQAGRARDVREGAVAIVAVQLQRRPCPGAAAGPVTAVDEQDVGPAVRVVVDEGAAGTECLGQELPATGAAVVAERQAGTPWHVRQLEARRLGRRAAVLPAIALPTVVAGLAGAAVISLVAAPFGQTLFDVANRVLIAGGGYQYLSVGAWNPWALVSIDGVGLAGTNGTQRLISRVVGKIPLKFNVSIRGPFRALIATAKSLRDPRTLIDTTLDTPLGNISGIVTEVRRREEDSTQTQTPVEQTITPAR